MKNYCNFVVQKLKGDNIYKQFLKLFYYSFQIEKYTLEKLKVFADVLKVSKQGRKAQVVNRIIQKYNIVTLG